MSKTDDPDVMEARDPEGILENMNDYVDGFLAAFHKASQAPLAAPAALTDVLIAGMGGSGIVGNLVSALVRPDCPVPTTMLKNYDVPSFVGPKTLVIAVSYSGNTEETLQVALEAKSRGATLIGLSSGGKLRDLTRRAPMRHLSVEPGFQPRVALPHLFGTLLGAFRALRLTTVSPDARFELEARKTHQGFQQTTPTSRNVAKQFARDLVDTFPTWYGTGPLSPVALRGRCQLNENAKMLARNDEIPEANHNDLVAWEGVKNGRDYFVGMLRASDEPPEIRQRYQFFERLLKRRKVANRTFTATGSTPLSRVMQSLMLVDYTSVYGAIERDVDPSDVSIIGELKRDLERTGKARDIARRIG